MARFFDVYNDVFTKQDGKYVLSIGMSKAQMKSILEDAVAHELRAICKDDQKTKDKYVLIGACYPKDSLLLDFKDGSYIPKKIEKALKEKPSMKWMLREDDICIDIDLVNDIFVELFNDMFNKPKKILSLLGDHYSNVIVVSHSHLDCYMMFKTIKWAYGKSNCKNVWKEDMQGHREVLMSLNDELAKHIRNKCLLNISGKFKAYAREVRDYLDERLGIQRSP